MVQTESLSKKERVERAIEHALERRWDLAAEANRALLDDDPQDVETANRLGKALTELDDLAGAADAYGRALTIDAANSIARKNLDRLGERRGGARSKPAPGAAAKSKWGATKRARSLRTAAPAVHSLVEESGKSAEFPLRQPNRQALRRVAAGDAAALQPVDQGVVVKSATGATLGTIEPRAGLRLMRMMEGGNGYAAVIRHVDDGEATVYIREVHTDPSLAGQASFITPPSAAQRRKAPRAYTKASVVRHERGDVEADANEDTHDEQDGRALRRSDSPDEQSGEMEERGFSEDRAADSDDVADDEDEADVEELGEKRDDELEDEEPA